MHYLADVARQDFAWGESDCCTFAIGWLDRVTGKDGMAARHDALRNEAACRAHLTANGGLAAVAGDFISKVYGLAQAAPAPGNVVVVRGLGEELLGIRVSDRDIAMRTSSRLMITSRATIVKEWGL